MSQKNDVEKLLKAAGFAIVRTGKHNIWEKDGVTVRTHCGSKVPDYELWRIQSAIRKMEKVERLRA